MRSHAATNSARSFARITPRLAARNVGFKTQGNRTLFDAASGSSPRSKTRYAGDGTAASARSPRIVALCRAAIAACTGLCASPSAREITAATTVVSSSTPTTAANGFLPANSTARRADADGSRKSSVSSPSGFSPSSVLALSDATVTSTPSPRAAARKSGVL